jgi:hypothetical protein
LNGNNGAVCERGRRQADQGGSSEVNKIALLTWNQIKKQQRKWHDRVDEIVNDS